jgi:hypothetical protein
MKVNIILKNNSLLSIRTEYQKHITKEWGLCQTISADISADRSLNLNL